MYDAESVSFENFIKFYEVEVRAIHRGEANAVRDFTASFRRTLVQRGVVVSRRGLPWVLTPRAEAVLGIISCARSGVWRVS